MINCIIYEDNEKMQNLYESIIQNFYNQKKQSVIFHKYKKYTKNLEKKLSEIKGTKIYILDIEVPNKSGLDLAREIRNNGDWNSPLIIISGYEHLKNTSFTSKMLMLDFISKKENIEERLVETLELTNVIVDNNESYIFQYNGELYNIDYKDILYFKKDLNDNFTTLYTNKDIYKIKENIIEINQNLNNNKNFIKINRSCIVNINNIRHFNVTENTIYFDETKIILSSKEGREFLIEKLKKEQTIK